MFTAALVTIANNQGMYKDVYTYTTEYYSATKEQNDAICSDMDVLEIIILSEVNQTQKDKYYMISLYMKPKKKDTKELIYKTELESQA